MFRSAIFIGQRGHDTQAGAEREPVVDRKTFTRGTDAVDPGQYSRLEMDRIGAAGGGTRGAIEADRANDALGCEVRFAACRATGWSGNRRCHRGSAPMAFL